MNSFAPVIFRVASWPIDTIRCLSSPEYAAEVDAALALKEQIRAVSEQLSADLYATIPRLDREERRTALRVRRALHSGTEPLAAHDLEGLCRFPEVGNRTKMLLTADDADRRRLKSTLDSLRTSYAGIVERECRGLLEIVGTDAFRKALALASPGASDALEQTLATGTHVASPRLRTTLLNYLLRAAGRATPNSMWAGVAMEAAGSDSHDAVAVRGAERRVFVKPDLNVFFHLYSAATAEPHYRTTVRLRLNPTLKRISSREYAYAHCRNGQWAICRIEDQGLIARLEISLSSSDPVMFDTLRRQTAIGAEALHNLYISGVLWPQCNRNGIHETAASALESLIGCLAPAEQHYWQKAVAGLRTICAKIENRYTELTVDALRSHIREARSIVNTLGRRYNAEACPDDRSVLICDITAPFQISLSSDLHRQLRDAVRSYWNFDRGGTGEPLARSARMALANDTSRDGALPLAGVSVQRRTTKPQSNGTADPANSCSESLRRWTAAVEQSATAAVCQMDKISTEHEYPLSPGAALVIPAITAEGISIRIGSLVPNWGAFYGRFHHMFEASGNSAFRQWLKQAVGSVGNAGVSVADVVIRGAHDRNAALRPQLGTVTLDPLHHRLQDVSAICSTDTGVRLEWADGRVLFPMLNTAVETGDADPWSQWFSRVNREAGRSSLQCPPGPLQTEKSTWKHCPRLVFGSHIILAPERWWCPPETLAQLQNCSGFDRFMAWRSWVRRMHVPRCSYIQYGDVSTESLLVADSLLQVEVIGRRLSQEPGDLRVQEMCSGVEGLWLKDEQGRAYVAEVALAWTGDPEFWAGTAAPRSAAESWQEAHSAS